LECSACLPIPIDVAEVGSSITITSDGFNAFDIIKRIQIQRIGKTYLMIIIQLLVFTQIKLKKTSVAYQ
jgi:hypothetical protein